MASKDSDNALGRQPSVTADALQRRATMSSNIQPHVAESKKRYLKRFLRAKRGSLMPSGLLAVHIKTLNLVDYDVYAVFHRYDINVYIRIWVNNVVKYTVMYNRVVIPCNLTFDELKHFRLVTSDSRGELCNNIRFEIIFNDPSQKEIHKIVSAKDLHVYNLMKDLCSANRVELRDLHRQKPVGELMVEVCFAYGTFGYGFSNQYIDKPKNPKDNLTHCIFYRPKPLEARTDVMNDTMVCRHVGHPSMIPFKSMAELDMYGEFQADTEWFATNPPEQPNIVAGHLTDRLKNLQSEMGALSSRKERLHFLRSWVSDCEGHIPINHSSFRLKPGFELQQRQPKIGKTSVATPLFEAKDIGMFTKMAALAPGVVKRPNEEQPSRTGVASSVTSVVRKFSTGVSTFTSQLRNMGRVFTSTEVKAENELTADEKAHMEEDRAAYTYDDRRYSWHM